MIDLPKTREQLEFFRKIVDTVPAIIYIKSQDLTKGNGKWKIEWMNSYGLSLLSYTREELALIDTDIYSGIGGDRKAECYVNFKSEPGLTIQEDEVYRLWRFYAREDNKVLYVFEQSQEMYSYSKEKVNRQVVIGQVFAPNQLNQPQLSLLLRQIHQTRYQNLFELLTNRETEVMELIYKGKTDKQISELLHIDLKTAKKHRNNSKKKLGACNTAQLVAISAEYGFMH